METYSIRVLRDRYVPPGQEKVVLYNQITGNKFVTTADRKDYYLSKRNPKQIMPDGSTRLLAGVDKLFGEHPPKVEAVIGRPSDEPLKTVGVTGSTRRRKRGSRGRR
jgi:hypothetical protein